MVYAVKIYFSSVGNFRLSNPVKKKISSPFLEMYVCKQQQKEISITIHFLNCTIDLQVLTRHWGTLSLKVKQINHTTI